LRHLGNLRVYYNTTADCKKIKDIRIKAHADSTEQKIKLRRAHAEAMMKRLMVVVVHLQE